MKLFKNYATVGGATLTSRVLGFFRDILIAASIGTGPIADAFFVAFRLPNLFRRLFAEGAFNAAFVPLFAKEVEEKGKNKAREFAEEIFAMLFWGLLILTIIAEVAAPIFVFLLAPGFISNPEKFDLAVLLTRITFPYLICMSILAFISGILNSFHRFAAAAFAPVILNIVLIIVLSAIFILNFGETQAAGMLLACGVSIAGVIQVVALYFAMKHYGFDVSLKRPRLTNSVRRLIKLGIPGVIAGGITQINIAVGTIIASTQAGAVSYLYYADRIYQLPLGVIGIAIGTVLLPNLSRQLKIGDNQAVLDSQNRSLEYGLALTLPATIALLVIPIPIVSTLFERGAFSAFDTNFTVQALIAYGIGLPAFVLIKIFSTGFFAREDTKTPMWFAGIGMTVNVVAALVMFPFIGHIGIALATSIAGWINAILLGFTLRRRKMFIADKTLIKRILLLTLGSLAMGFLVWLGSIFVVDLLVASNIFMRFGALAILVILGISVYMLFLQLTGVIDILKYLHQLSAKESPNQNNHN